MIAMIFEYWIDVQGDDYVRYIETSTVLRDQLTSLEGFVSVERFESCSEPGKFVAIGFFDDEDSVTRWRNEPVHRQAQTMGRREFFADYRLRMATVHRDYGRSTRREAPTDSNQYHLG